MEKRILVIGLISILLLSSVIPISIGQDVKIPDNKGQSSNLGNTLYVGGSGPNNYTKIQDAINDSFDGDTVFVFDDSSPYYENLLIMKSISLVGEDKNTTILDSNNTDYILGIGYADYININGFTIQNSRYFGIAVLDSGFNNFSNNIFKNIRRAGIYIDWYPGTCDYSYISNNIFINNSAGIVLGQVSYTNIIGNIFTDCFNSLSIGPGGLTFPLACDNNIIWGNLFDNNIASAMNIRGNNNLITKNTISNTYNPFLFPPAVIIEGSKNIVTCNNFINNTRDASDTFFILSLKDFFKIRKDGNVFDGNYWEKPLSSPKIIFCMLYLFRPLPNRSSVIPFFNIDRHPAKKPYDN